jgi:para-nitrobenzyl esterase
MTKERDRTAQAHGADINRRNFLFKAPVAAVGIGALVSMNALEAASVATGQKPAGTGSANYSGAGVPRLIVQDGAAEVDTAYGRVRGFIRNDIRTFRGVPYGGDTSGPNRFMPPTKPTPWKGARSSLYWGQGSPQVVPKRDNDEVTFFANPPAAEYGENCLCLNVWTPGLDNAKRPVMVWMHGGGFSFGIPQLCFYDGENLSHRGDVVVVSIHHRLNVVGFLNLASYSSKYADSANVGMMDLVAALKWVHENIAGFGGDPDKVMILGQSGGGGKVMTTLAMPAAKGFVHRAAIQSMASSGGRAMMDALLKGRSDPAEGVAYGFTRPEQSADVAARLLTELNIIPSHVDDLQKVPIDRLVEAGGKIRGSWGPTVDGRSLPNTPFYPTAPEISADVPLLVGNVLNENVYSVGHPELENMTETEAKALLTKTLGDGDTIYEAFLKAYPGSRPYDVYSVAMATPGRQGSLILAERKTAQGRAPAYNYLFTWKSKILNGRPRSFHMVELPFVFYTTDLSEARIGATDEARELAGRVCDCWVAFARTGNPNHPGIPHWPAYDPRTVPTMIFDNVCTVKNDPSGEARGTIKPSTT